MFDFVIDALSLYLKPMAGFWIYWVFALALLSCIPCILHTIFRR